MPLLGHIPSQLPLPLALKFPTALMPLMMKSAFILALLGTIDSLLTSLVADNLTDTYHDSDQEMVGQGIGNALAGLFGGIPSAGSNFHLSGDIRHPFDVPAGATMRTVVNIRSGGRTRLAGMVHSMLLLTILMGGGSLAKNIPLATLAGILMKTGWDIIDKRFIARLSKLPPATGIVMVFPFLNSHTYLTLWWMAVDSLADDCICGSDCGSRCRMRPRFASPRQSDVQNRSPSLHGHHNKEDRCGSYF